MDKRQAKREACRLAALILESEVMAGIVPITNETDGTERSEADRDRFEAALIELAGELMRRSG